MDMVTENDQTFEGLISHIMSAFQSRNTASDLISDVYAYFQKARQYEDTFTFTVSDLISDFYAYFQKARQYENTFIDDLQFLTWKIIVHKPLFQTMVNEQLKHQYMQILQNLYYAATVYGMLQTSVDMESFTQFCGCLTRAFGSYNKPC